MGSFIGFNSTFAHESLRTHLLDLTNWKEQIENDLNGCDVGSIHMDI